MLKSPEKVLKLLCRLSEYPGSDCKTLYYVSILTWCIFKHRWNIRAECSSRQRPTVAAADPGWERAVGSRFSVDEWEQLLHGRQHRQSRHVAHSRRRGLGCHCGAFQGFGFGVFGRGCRWQGFNIVVAGWYSSAILLSTFRLRGTWFRYASLYAIASLLIAHLLCVIRTTCVFL